MSSTRLLHPVTKENLYERILNVLDDTDPSLTEAKMLLRFVLDSRDPVKLCAHSAQRWNLMMTSGHCVDCGALLGAAADTQDSKEVPGPDEPHIMNFVSNARFEEKKGE